MKREFLCGASAVVEAERGGREVRYRLVDPDVMVACAVMRGVLQRRLDRLAEVTAQSARPRPMVAAGGDA